jgi:hypothetical protein
MNTENTTRNILRLWFAGAMHIGLFAGQVGAFALAMAGFVGWITSEGRHSTRRRRACSADVDAPRFTLR